jgi:hypothetical protein
VSRLCHCPLGIVRLVMDVPLHAATPQSTVFLGHCGASFLHLRPTNASPAQWRRLFYSFLGALVPGDAFTGYTGQQHRDQLQAETWESSARQGCWRR